MTATDSQPTTRSAVNVAGLSSLEAERRLADVGPNAIAAEDRFRLLRAPLTFASNPLVIILLVASIVSGLFGEVVNATLIALMVVLSVGLDFVQVFRSD